MSAPPRTPTRAVPRHLLALAILGSIALLVLAVEGVDRLRHPPAGGEPTVADVDSDPRLEVRCPDLGQLGDDDASVGDVLSNDLYDCPAVYDGRTIRYTGEVVGAVLRRGDHAWVHLNDDVYADVAGPLPAHRDYQGRNGGVGVRIPLALADEIAFVGGATARGDVLAVDGVFHQVHGPSREAVVVVAARGEVVQRGQPFVDPVLPDRAIAAGVLAALALGLAVTERVVARRRR